MQFKEAAFEILKKTGKPLHYREIWQKAVEAGIISSTGLTPESSMGALLYTDTQKPDSRFRRGDKPGTFMLKTFVPGSIQLQIENIYLQVKKSLLKHLIQLSPQKFEELIRILLEQMGFEEAVTTSFSNDKGVDVRGILRSNPLSEVKIAIQAKRWSHNVGSGIVRDLRGSLNVADSEQGLIITTGNFSASAIEESRAPGRTPIRLINGSQLVDLLIENNVGVITKEYTVPTIDSDYWSEVLGVTFQEEEPVKISKKQEPSKINQVLYPLEIHAQYKGQAFSATLLSIEGQVMYNDLLFQTPTAAAKTIVEWKTVNGWDFWHYENPNSGKSERINKIRKP